MNRRILRLGLFLACVGSALPGCEWIDHNIRPRAGIDEPPPQTTETKPATGVDATNKEGFFNSSRLSGAMSSEGRDVERSLGVQ
jgi:hypothetical protein